MKRILSLSTIGFLLFLYCGTATNAVRPLFLSEPDEIALGNKFKEEILSDTENYPEYTENQDVIDYIRNMGQKIARAQKDRDTLPFTFTIIDVDTMINAFAIPGGHVFIYTGLIKNATNGAQVAGVVAHEIGHITKYHGANRLVQSSFASSINDILFGDSSSAAKTVATIVESMVFLKYSKNDEYQADSCAVAYTLLSDYNPVGMKQFLQKLYDLYGEQPKIFEPFSTHPPLSKRVEETQKHINELSNDPSDVTTGLFVDEFEAIKAKL